ncbi:BTB domain-containing protein [Favolaschia claudopus]|uniref:BTB domain-containing protein n=1 Tax=Favolaschia claudopus TaxID=2862362 RepID=A0AAV9ZHK6_9AGAR
MVGTNDANFDKSITLWAHDSSHIVEDLWFDDGTLVITTEAACFRIYGGHLAKESCIFRDMLQLCQPAGTKTIEQCPVVHLVDDSRDVEYFLKALLDHSFFLPFPAPTTFAIIAGVARLSKKYEVNTLYTRALSHFASAFPVSPKEKVLCSWRQPGLSIPAALLARELELDWALPIALYRVCAYSSTDEILCGIDLDSFHFELELNDKQSCLKECVLMRGADSTNFMDFLWNPEKINGCMAPNVCKDRRLARRKFIEVRRHFVLPFDLWTDDDWAGCVVCGPCLSAMRAAYNATLEKFWDSLPRRFALPAWDKLKERRCEALELD